MLLTSTHPVRYHWAFIVGPKIETPGARGTRYHVTVVPPDETGCWLFEERDCPLAPTKRLLVRILIAEVGNKARLENVLRNTPPKPEEHDYNCVLWVKEALVRLEADGEALRVGTVEWETVRDSALGYCWRKRDQNRFDGTGDFDATKVPTYDLIQRKELTI